jgi:hypothetical protein
VPGYPCPAKGGAQIRYRAVRDGRSIVADLNNMVTPMIHVTNKVGFAPSLLHRKNCHVRETGSKILVRA